MAKSQRTLSNARPTSSRRPPAQPGRGRGASGGRAAPGPSGSRWSAGLVSAIAIAVVVVVVGALVAVKLTSGGGRGTTVKTTSAAPADVVQAATHVPPTALAAAGLGTSGTIVAPRYIKGGAPLTLDGKPEVLYVGAEYCPYCAAERWPMVVALSRFGTFSGLGTTESSTSDKYPGTQTFSFYGSHYSSPFLAFTPVETQTNQVVNGNYAPLQSLTSAQQKLIQTYDAPPYVSSQSSGGIPFVDFANHYVISGATYNPQVLQGLALGSIAGSLSNPSVQPAQSIDAAANSITAAICKVTGNQPAAVCTTAVVAKAEAALPKK